MSKKETEAIAEAVRDVQDNADVATKKDLAVTEARLELKIAETKADLIRWVLAVGVLQTTLIGAMLLKLLPS